LGAASAAPAKAGLGAIAIANGAEPATIKASNDLRIRASIICWRRKYQPAAGIAMPEARFALRVAGKHSHA
jgi:hypothetical protein